VDEQDQHQYKEMPLFEETHKKRSGFFPPLKVTPTTT